MCAHHFETLIKNIDLAPSCTNTVADLKLPSLFARRCLHVTPYETCDGINASAYEWWQSLAHTYGKQYMYAYTYACGAAAQCKKALFWIRSCDAGRYTYTMTTHYLHTRPQPQLANPFCIGFLGPWGNLFPFDSAGIKSHEQARSGGIRTQHTTTTRAHKKFI